MPTQMSRPPAPPPPIHHFLLPNHRDSKLLMCSSTNHSGQPGQHLPSNSATMPGCCSQPHPALLLPYPHRSTLSPRHAEPFRPAAYHSPHLVTSVPCEPHPATDPPVASEQHAPQNNMRRPQHNLRHQSYPARKAPCNQATVHPALLPSKSNCSGYSPSAHSTTAHQVAPDPAPPSCPAPVLPAPRCHHLMLGQTSYSPVLLLPLPGMNPSQT